MRFTSPPSPSDTSGHHADVQLMQLAAQGDRGAQGVVVSRLMGRANRLAVALLRNRDDASDASQAGLLEILRSASGYRGESSLERWADRIVVRACMRLSHARRRDACTDIDECKVPSILPGGDSSMNVDQVLRRLSERQRTALLLRSGYGYSLEEIAEMTQCSVNTVKDRLKRARELVRRSLKKQPTRLGQPTVSAAAGRKP
jgi:RNA polymerase sigma factor (sigma-70 family)